MIPKWVSHVDWFTATLKVDIRNYGEAALDSSVVTRFAQDVFYQYGMGGEGVVAERANQFYRYAVRDVESGATLHIPLVPENQGVMLVATGTACRRLTDATETMRLLHRDGWTFTRVDMAFDVFDSGTTVDDMAAHYAIASNGNKQRKVTIIRSRKGDTLAIGARSSAKYYRIYDKAGEQGLDMDWIRVEAEYKQEAAMHAAQALFENPTAWISDVLRLYDTPLISGLMDAMRDARTTDAAIPSTSPFARDGRERWLQQTVIPAMTKMLFDSPEGFAEAMRQIMFENGYRKLVFALDENGDLTTDLPF